MKFRAKPVEIDAMLWTGSNAGKICEFMKVTMVAWDSLLSGGTLYLNTLEGTMEAEAGDWIVRGLNGQFYPCKPEVFTMTYVPVEDQTL